MKTSQICRRQDQLSIIYDALNKTQQNREDTDLSESETLTKSSIPSSRRWGLLIGLISGISLILIGCMVLLGKNYYDLHRPVPQSTPVISKLILNGVFLSNKNKMAMINNQAYNLGDKINGMEIVAIDFNGIKLQNDNSIVEIQTAV